MTPKKLILTAINCTSEEQTVRTMRKIIFDLNNKQWPDLKPHDWEFLKAYYKHRPNWGSYIKECRIKHKLISHWICNSEQKFSSGLILMNKDSKIMRRIIMHFINMGVPCLPVHDSVILQEEYEKELKEVMDWAYTEEMGKQFTCGIDKK